MLVVMGLWFGVGGIVALAFEGLGVALCMFGCAALLIRLAS